MGHFDNELKPAVAIPPGETIVAELEARGWTQVQLAEIMQRPLATINEIIKAKKAITPETAKDLAAAFGTSAELWLNLESQYRLALVEEKEDTRTAGIERRARLYDLAPISELRKRGWMSWKSTTVEDIEAAVCSFFGASTIAEAIQQRPTFAHFRHSQARGPDEAAKNAWVRRVQILAEDAPAKSFDLSFLRDAVPDLVAASATAKGISRVPDILRDAGIRFVILGHLPRTYVDGVYLSNSNAPIIALSLRYDRVDSFWFTLLHEIGHIILGHSDSLDCTEQDCPVSVSDEEAAANLFAVDRLIPPDAYGAFVRETAPYFGKNEVQKFASRIDRHPAIVLGRLQKDGKVGYAHLRALLERASPHLGLTRSLEMGERLA